MYRLARQRLAVLLLLAGIAWTDRRAPAAPPPATQPSHFDSFSINPSESLIEQRLTVSPQAGEPFALPGPAQSSPPATRPAAPESQAIYNPLPPALWSGLSVLALAGAVLMWRRFKLQLR